MKRPLVWIALVYIGGLLLAELYQPPLVPLFAISLGLGVGALALPAARPWLIWALVLFTGWTNLTFRTALLSPHDLRLIVGSEPILATIRGTLTETPGHRTYVRNEKETTRTIAQVRVSHLQCGNDAWQPAFGDVLVTTPTRLPDEIYARHVVQITGVLAPPPRPVAEGLFDYCTYLRRHGIHYLLTASTTNDWQVLDGRHPRPLGDRFRAWARASLARGLPVEDEPLRLIWAMSLGWKPALTHETYEPFMRSGTMHIFAISGLHVALIAGILTRLLRLLQVPRVGCGWVVIPLIWFYTAATGWQASAIRATVMMSIIIGGWALKRPSDLLNSLAAAALLILLWDPRQIFTASFQLSFLVVLSIALLAPPLEAMRNRLLQSDPLVPADLLPRWRRGLEFLLRGGTAAAVVSLAAWMGSLPLTAYYFHLFSPVTVLANLVIVPLSSLTLAAIVGSLICGSWLPWVGECFNHSGWLWMSCMVKLSEWATQLPGAYYYVRGPAGWGVIAGYLILIGGTAGLFLPAKPRRWTLMGVAVLAGFYAWQWLTMRPPASLTVIPVNGGMALYYHASNQSDRWLMDCGSTNSVEFVTKPFLRAQGINSLPALILTHGDLRHIGGADVIADLFHARQILVSPVRFRSPKYRLLLQEFERKPQWLRRISSGDRFGPWKVLHPEADDRFGQADDNAMVLLGNFHGTRVLLLSDLGRTGQNALLERTPDLRADIVVTGLPSQYEALSDALLEAIQPRLIIVADSEFPAAERATAKLTERLACWKVPVIYTRNTGAATLELRPFGWKVRTMNGDRFTSKSPKLKSNTAGQ